jgi:hypothetical protein
MLQSLTSNIIHHETIKHLMNAAHTNFTATLMKSKLLAPGSANIINIKQDNNRKDTKKPLSPICYVFESMSSLWNQNHTSVNKSNIIKLKNNH